MKAILFQIVNRLFGGVSRARIEPLAKERGFTWDPEFESRQEN
jgi:hypothetical protein